MKGIAFTDALAQAVHEGRKTVTRRLVKPQPPADADEVFLFDAEDARRQLGDGWEYAKSGLWARRNGRHEGDVSGWLRYVCRAPYTPGEVVYVKEPYLIELPPDFMYDAEGLSHGQWPAYLQTASIIHYRANTTLTTLGAWKSPRFMPEWAARTKLRIVSCTPEWLQDITGDEAMAEGVPCACWSEEDWVDSDGYLFGHYERKACALREFAVLWNSIHKPPHDWDSDPWVWRIEFGGVAE